MTRLTVLQHCLKSIANSGNLSVFQEDIGVQIALVLQSSTKDLFSPAAEIFAALISSEYMEPFLDGYVMCQSLPLTSGLGCSRLS